MSVLECGICNARETDYGFEYYIPTLKKQCGLRLCVFCKLNIQVPMSYYWVETRKM